MGDIDDEGGPCWLVEEGWRRTAEGGTAGGIALLAVADSKRESGGEGGRGGIGEGGKSARGGKEGAFRRSRREVRLFVLPQQKRKKRGRKEESDELYRGGGGWR